MRPGAREPAPPGLRERKKARTRAAIQAAALDLFARLGYHGATVEEIAERAEVSPSTFFRYFPTKEDVVLYDRYDPLLFADFRAQPRDLGVIAALRGSLRTVLGALTAGELERERRRALLIMSVPELRARALDQLASTLGPLTEAIAERAGRSPQDPAVRALTGAVVGVGIAAMFDERVLAQSGYLDVIDEHLANLEDALAL